MNISISILGACAVTKNLDQKWRDFPKMLSQRGFTLVPCTSEIQSHHFELEAYSSTLSNFGKNLLSEQRTLIRVEPRVVNPFQYRAKVVSKFGCVFVINPYEFESESIKYWQSGYINFRAVIETKPTRRINSAALINESKFSFVKGSNYKLRNEIIRKMCKHGYDFNLAGRYWDASIWWFARKQLSALLIALRYPLLIDLSQFERKVQLKSKNMNYLERVDSAIGFLSSYDFAIVVENESTYVSEKLLNSVLAGAIPIYYGPRLETYGIPSGIAFTEAVKPRDFLRIMESMSDFEKKKIREAGKLWINNPQVQNRWSVEAGFNRLIDMMTERVLNT